MYIYLINHTEVYNPRQLFYGQSEMPLTENFTFEFSRIKDYLNFHTSDVDFISSPLRRCSKLASYLSDDNYKTDDNLLDINLGLWEMEDSRNINEALLTNYKESPFSFKFPEGESLVEVKKRHVKGYKNALKSKRNNIVIVCHSSTIKSIVAEVIGLNIKHINRLSSDFGSVHKIEYDRGDKSQRLVFSNLTL